MYSPQSLPFYSTSVLHCFLHLITKAYKENLSIPHHTVKSVLLIKFRYVFDLSNFSDKTISQQIWEHGVWFYWPHDG